jgi:outer membrane protein assembly factor BamB
LFAITSGIKGFEGTSQQKYITGYRTSEMKRTVKALNTRIFSLAVCLLLIGGPIGLFGPYSETVGATGLADSSWPCFRGDVRHTGLSKTPFSHVNGSLKWSYTAGSQMLSSSSPVIGADGTIYLGMGMGLKALDPDGKLKWEYGTGDVVHSIPAVGSDGTIYVGSYDDQLYALGPDGKLKWSYNTGGWIYSSPAIGSDGTIYLGTENKKMIALGPDGKLKWEFNANSSVRSSPAIGSDGTIYFGSYEGNLYALNKDGTLEWNYTTGDYVHSSPTIGSEGTIYFASEDNYVYALNHNGSLKWKYATGFSVHSSPAIGSDGTIYIGSLDKKVYALRPDGTLKWSFLTKDMVYSSPAVGSDGTVYIGSNDNSLYALNPDGTKKWNYTTNNDVYASPAIGPDGTVYANSWDGHVYAFGATNLPGAPKDLPAVAQNRSVILRWAPPADDGGAPISGYRIFRGNISGGEVFVISVGVSTYYNDTGLTNGKTYYYKISAVNSVGEGPRSNEVDATPRSIPSAPETLQATAGNGYVYLTWDQPKDDGGSRINEFKIFRGTVSGKEEYLSTIGNITYYNDTNLTNGKTYYYKVCAKNDVGEGPRSKEVDARPVGKYHTTVISFFQYWWILIVLIIVILALLAFYMYRRRAAVPRGP